MLSSHTCTRPVVLPPDLPAVSFTFDDFPRTAFTTGGAILQKYGCTATYYTALGLAGRTGPVGPYFTESDLREVLRAGHEIGCHTFDHLHAWDTPPEEYARSILRNRDHLRAIVPEASFPSHSYPISIPHPGNKRQIAQRFPCARGGGQRANQQYADANYLNSFFIEKARNHLSTVKALIDRAGATASWLIFSTHDVCNTPSPFGCTPELFEAIVHYTIEKRIPVVPVSHIAVKWRPR